MLTDDQKQVVRIAWEMESSHGGSFYRYAKEFIKDPDWGRPEIIPVYHDGKCCGGFYFAGPEVHAYVTRPTMIRRFLRKMDQQVRDWGYCLTFVASDNINTLRSMLRVGFKIADAVPGAFALRLEERLYE